MISQYQTQTHWLLIWISKMTVLLTTNCQVYTNQVQVCAVLLVGGESWRERILLNFLKTTFLSSPLHTQQQESEFSSVSISVPDPWAAVDLQQLGKSQLVLQHLARAWSRPSNPELPGTCWRPLCPWRGCSYVSHPSSLLTNEVPSDLLVGRKTYNNVFFSWHGGWAIRPPASWKHMEKPAGRPGLEMSLHRRSWMHYWRKFDSRWDIVFISHCVPSSISFYWFPW